MVRYDVLLVFDVFLLCVFPLVVSDGEGSVVIWCVVCCSMLRGEIASRGYWMMCFALDGLGAVV
ncbi:hypothetical protein M758_2G107700 [Ceratodon purpureus]|nr:hypothetical protein M758_2G107700 [Ceratodon purpureus]